MEIGEEFSPNDSTILREALRRQSVIYFRAYHVGRLEELKMFLENETWQWCPVKSTFHITQLHVKSPLPQKRRRAVFLFVAGISFSSRNAVDRLGFNHVDVVQPEIRFRFVRSIFVHRTRTSVRSRSNANVRFLFDVEQQLDRRRRGESDANAFDSLRRLRRRNGRSTRGENRLDDRHEHHAERHASFR